MYSAAPRSARRFALLTVLGGLACVVGLSGRAAAQAQSLPAAPDAIDTTIFYKALDLESAGKYREAAPLFRLALHTTAAENALLGLERVYAELGWTDSLVAPLDSLIARDPRNETYRTVELRTMQTTGGDAAARAAVGRWIREVPGSALPYREYARLLLEKNRAADADSVLARAGSALGSLRDLQFELAQARAAEGAWVESAQAWREALRQADYLEQAAAYALAPTPASTRGQIRDIFLAQPVEVSSRRALADLEMTWGAPGDAWDALSGLTPDSAAAAAWSDFADRAEAEERWTLARQALEAALRWRRAPDIALRAANAALNAGDAAAALDLAPLADAKGDSNTIAQSYLPLRVKALAALGRPAEAEALVEGFDRLLPPGVHNSLVRTIAWGWVRSGDMTKARAALATTGAEGDSSDAAGWLALYDGNLKTARVLLRGGTESTPELALALGIIARVKADTAPAIGHAFLALARGDSAGAATQFAQAADQRPSVRSVLLATAAQIQSARHQDAQAVELWKRILDSDPDTPEAPEAELAWARTLRRSGDAAGAVSHLEHLILTYPESALVPQARRELDLLKSGTPPCD